MNRDDDFSEYAAARWLVHEARLGPDGVPDVSDDEPVPAVSCD